MDYLTDTAVRELLARARNATELTGFLETLKTLAELCMVVEPLAAEVQRLRQRVVLHEGNLTQYARTVAAKDTELMRVRAEVSALEKRSPRSTPRERMLTPASPDPVPTLDRLLKMARRQAVTPAAPGRATDEVGVLLGTQWPGPRHAQRAGWPALAAAVISEAVLDAGIAPRRGPVRQRNRWSAPRYLLEADDAVPFPLETACRLADLDPDRVRAVVRLRLP
jgi:hypothetical protein